MFVPLTKNLGVCFPLPSPQENTIQFFGADDDSREGAVRNATDNSCTKDDSCVSSIDPPPPIPTKKTYFPSGLRSKVTG